MNAVSSSLIRQPNFKQKDDAVRLDLIVVADHTAVYDPEFILKVYQTSTCLCVCKTV